MKKEEQIIKRINQIWNEILRETSLERIAIKVVQIKQLFEVIDRKELIVIEPEKSSRVNKEIINKVLDKEIKKLEKFKE